MTAPRVLIGFNPNGTRGFTISPSRSKTHPNLQTHPDLPKGKEQVTPDIDTRPNLTSSPTAQHNHFSPHLTSPEE